MELTQLVSKVGIRVNNVKPVDIFAFGVVFSFPVWYRTSLIPKVILHLYSQMPCFTISELKTNRIIIKLGNITDQPDFLLLG